jgi:hypothetical protein
VAIIRGFSFRVGPPVTVAGVERALSGLPIGDGLLLHRVVQIAEDGHLVFVEMHIGDPVTLDRIELARRRVSQALEYAFVTAPQPTGLDGPGGRDPYEDLGLFARELDRIEGPPLSEQAAGFFDRLTTALSGAGLLAVGVGIVVLVLALRR